MTKQLPYGTQTIEKDDVHKVSQVLRSSYLTQGPVITAFEKKLAAKVDAKFAVVFNSGTAALHAAYFAAGLKTGDEIITTPISFVATGNAALYLGAKPVFVDVEKDTGNIDAEKIEKAMTKKTKLIVPVHYGGNPVDLKKISGLVKKHKIAMIEDASHALGAAYRGTKTGSGAFSAATVFSFHPVKHITTGEGGAVTTNDENLYKKMLLFRSHGITKNHFLNKSKKDGDWYYEMQVLGFNYRLTDLQAALGISQLKKLDKFLAARQKIAALYDDAFRNNRFFTFLKIKPEVINSYHLYPILLNDKLKSKKKEIFEKLRNAGIGVQVHYIPIYQQPYYRRLGYQPKMCPGAEDFYHREISIPMYPRLGKSDIAYVIKTLFQICQSYD